MTTNSNLLRDHAQAIGNHLADVYPPAYREGYPTVPSEHLDAITEEVTLVVAEIIQAWIDAGSERDAVMEELSPHIRNELKGWTELD